MRLNIAEHAAYRLAAAFRDIVGEGSFQQKLTGVKTVLVRSRYHAYTHGDKALMVHTMSANREEVQCEPYDCIVDPNLGIRELGVASNNGTW